MRKNKKEIKNEIDPVEKFRDTLVVAIYAYYRAMRYPHLKK